MEWIYLSPHLDDVALSVGGLLWEQSQAGERVVIWTVCAGDPPPGKFSPFAESLHTRWETGDHSMAVRRREDTISCQRLGVNSVHFAIPDCIYRRSPFTGQHLYASEESLWIPVHPDEEPLIAQLVAQFKTQFPSGANLVCPLTLGGHVDHRLTRIAAEKLGVPLWFYADYPYVLETGIFSELGKKTAMITPLSPDGLLAWQEAVAAHGSQISTFWQNLSEMQVDIQVFAREMGGVRLFSSGDITKPDHLR